MNVFLTGPVQVGKSTAIRRYLDTRPGIRTGGFVTVSRPMDDGGLGVYILPPGWSDAECTPDRLAGLRGPRYGAVPETFERAGLALLQAEGPFDLLLMDELGRMELRSPHFCAAVLAALDGPVPILGVVKPESNPLLDAVRAHPGTALLEVTEANRGGVPERIARLLGSGCSDA